MITLYNPHHALHHGKLEMFRGELAPCFEVPARAYFVRQEILPRGLGLVQQPQGESQPIHRSFASRPSPPIHTSRYLDFPAHAWVEGVALNPANAAKDAFPSLWPVRSFRTDVLPANFSERMGLFSWDAGTPITSGT